jgi:hypothetical protein
MLAWRLTGRSHLAVARAQVKSNRPAGWLAVGLRMGQGGAADLSGWVMAQTTVKGFFFYLKLYKAIHSNLNSNQ